MSLFDHFSKGVFSKLTKSFEQNNRYTGVSQKLVKIGASPRDKVMCEVVRMLVLFSEVSVCLETGKRQDTCNLVFVGL